MALIQFTGFESGTDLDLFETAVFGVLATVSATYARTGTYSARSTPNGTGTSCDIRVYGLTAEGHVTEFSRTAATYYGFAFYAEDLPASDTILATVRQSTGSSVLNVWLTTTGEVRLANPSGTYVVLGTVAADEWNYVEFKCVSNGACNGRLNEGATSGDVTGANLTQTRLVLSGSEFETYDIYFDDVYIDDAGWLGGVGVTMLPSTGDSAANTDWTASAGAKWECVSGDPLDSEEITSGTGAGDKRYSTTHPSCASAGITGTIVATKVQALVREPSATSTLGAVGIRSGGTNYENTQVDWVNNFSRGLCRIDEVDPDTGVAWVDTDLDSAEALVMRSASDTSNIECGWLGIMVLEAVDNAAPAGVSAAADAAANPAVIAAQVSVVVGGVAATADAVANPAVVFLVPIATIFGESAAALAAANPASVTAHGVATIAGEPATATALALPAVIDAEVVTFLARAHLSAGQGRSNGPLNRGSASAP
jgi:hypothetical protein